MAKYKLKNSNNVVNCEILNESANDYIVRFKNGVIQNVPKNRVTNLDNIDEGVLDTVRGAAETVNKYGRKFASKVKDIAKKVAEFVVNAFMADGFVFFDNTQGDVIPAIHPVNMMELAKQSDGINYIPGSGTIKLCNELGIEPEAIENFEYENYEYDGDVQFFDYQDVNESLKSSSLFKAIFEDEHTFLKTDEKINLRGTFCDFTKNDIVDTIYEEYMERYNGEDPEELPLMIWGAPGIGKTAIIRSLMDIVKNKTGNSIEIISINGGNVGPDDFTMPATIVKRVSTKDSNLDDENEKVQDITKIKDLPKDWLPVYDPRSKDEAGEPIDPKLSNAIANGGGLVKDENGNDVIEDGPGGILFIDEYSRLSLAGMDSLMMLPTTRNIGSNSTLRLGDRWVIVCAANRIKDMSNRGSGDALMFEGASKTRFNHCNFVPDPHDWLEWAGRESTKIPGEKNIIPEIRNYIESELKRDPKDFGDFYEMWKMPKGELDGDKASACPRTWAAASARLRAKVKYNKYKSVSSMPKSDIVKFISGIVGGDVAKRFATFVSQYSLFTPQDAENVWTKGDNVKYEIIKQQKLNSANIEEYFDNHVFPLLKECYPGGLNNGVSPDAALHFMQFLEACCYDGGKFNLNRFKTISTKFGFEFNVDLKSITGPYADAANYKEEVIAKNELV